jgi:hypothetical protein
MSHADVERNTRLLIVDDNRLIHDDFRKILSRQHRPSRQFEAATEAFFGEVPGHGFSL